MTSMLPLSTLSPLPVIPDSNQALTSELTRLAGHINAAQYRFLKLLAALIERDAWGGDSGMKTPAHWLNYYCGIDLGAAREKVRVAKALATLPLIDAAFASGAISYSKVRAMTRCATPAQEAELLNVARHGTAQHVEKLVRLHQRVQRLQAKTVDGEQTQHQARELFLNFDNDGMLVLRGRLAPEAGAVLVKALEAALDVSAETSTDEVSESTFPQKRADALMCVAEQFLAAGQQDTDLASPPCSGHDRPPLTNADKYQVLVHFAAQNGAESAAFGMPAQLDDGPPLPESTLKRLACDASLVPVLRDDSGDVLNIGRKTRAVPPALRRALKIRDGGCRYPGCCQTRYVDAHHIRHWCEGGETSLDNLVLLCRHHHRLLHENVFSIVRMNASERDDRTSGDPAASDARDKKCGLQFLDTRGQEIRRALWPQFAAPLARDDGRMHIEMEHERLGLAIDADTAVTLWQGERMDYGMAMDGLAMDGLAMDGLAMDRLARHGLGRQGVH